LIDVQYLITELSSLDGVDGPGNHLEVCVNNIKIKDKRTRGASLVPSLSPDKKGVPALPTSKNPPSNFFPYDFQTRPYTKIIISQY
jgi:hypothetical protein